MWGTLQILMIDPNDMEIINLKITAKVSNVSNNDFVTTGRERLIRTRLIRSST